MVSNMLDMYKEASKYISDVNYQLTLTETNGVFTDYSMKGNVILQLPVPLELTMDITGDREKTDMDVSVKGRYAGKINFHMNRLTGETDESVKTAPPAGEKIVLKSSLE